MDDLEKDILSRLGSGKRMISDIEESGQAARQTLHTRIEGLIAHGYLQEEREEKLPFRRYLSLTDKGKDVLELEISRDRAELEERAEEEKDSYRTGWLFRDFVHNDLNPRESIVKGTLKMVGTLGVLPAYKEIFRPAFKPSENERDYAELLMRLFVDSVDYEGLLGKDEGLRAFADTYPPYRRTIARGCWIMATGFKGEHFDYDSAFRRPEVRKLTGRAFVKKLEGNYLESLNEECSQVAEERVSLNRDGFLEVLCWMRLKMRNLPPRAYDRLRERLLLIALADLSLVEKGRAPSHLS
jgi:DNA-binding MarR family transcriptional regulator